MTPAVHVRNGVTIGFPLFNEEKYIEAAIRSAVAQCEAGWISDNASTDESPAICDAMTRAYPHVALVRHERNMGAWLNFKYALDKATTPFFMWLGGHDLLPEGYVEALTARLQRSPGAVLAYGAVRYIDATGNPIGAYEYGFSELLADPSPRVRTLALIRHLEDCALVHGIFRTEVLRRAMNACGLVGYLGADHVLLGQAALEGPLVYARETHLVRRVVRKDDTEMALLKRMMGQAPPDPGLREEPASKRTMQRAQYALADRASRGDGVAGVVYRLRARHHLVQRFGIFGDTFLDEALDRLLQRRPIQTSMNRLDRLFTDGRRL